MKSIIKLTESDLHKIVKDVIYDVLSESYNGILDNNNEDELSKAALKNGFNYIAYHNTNNPNLRTFYNREAGIHFGSLKAANDRGEMRDWDDEVENWTNKYFLKFKNPLVIEKDFDWEMENFDDWMSPDDDKIYDDINIYAYFEKELGWNIMIYDENGEPLCGKGIKEIINEHGYDCIIYRNEREDVGNYSIAMFNPNNIKLASITYDDNGNKIPLEKRFNTSTNDVRY